MIELIDGKAAHVVCDFQDYKKYEAVNHSSLKHMKDSPSKYQHELNRVRPSTDSQKLGSSIHAAILEPEVFERDYAKMPKFDGRTKAGKEGKKEWTEANKGKIGLTEIDWNIVNGCRRRVENDSFISQFFKNAWTERSYFEQRELYKVKGRVDAFLPEKNFLVDLKTCQSANQYIFNADITKYGYVTQAAFYMDLVERTTGNRPEGFVIVAVETSRDFDANVFFFEDEHLKKGTKNYEQWLQRLDECIKSKKWCGYDRNFISYSPPAWF